MTIIQIIQSFAHDKQLGLVLTLIVADFVLGVLAAFKMGTFRLTYIANFVHNDLLGKVVPWFAVFALDKSTHAAGIVGPVDFNQANLVAFGLVSAAMVGSIMSSLMDLGVNLPITLGGHAPAQIVSAPVGPVQQKR